MPELNAKAPNFTLKDANNESISLSDFKGKNIVLYFYPKDNTSGCTKQAIGFTEHKKAFTDLNTIIIGISKDSVNSHQKFIEKQKLDLILLSDPETTVNQLYDVWKEKSMYGKKYFGTQRSTFLIDAKGTLIHEWRNVKVPGHVEDVLSVIKDR